MRIVSFHNGHNSTAAYFDGNSIKYSISEERFSKIKNQGGFPQLAINYVLSKNDVKPTDVDTYVVCGNHPTNQFFSETKIKLDWLSKVKGFLISLENQFSLIMYINNFLRKYYGFGSDKRVNARVAEMNHLVAEKLKISVSKIKRFDHHLCHAATVYYGLCDLQENWLIITVDGGGDDYSMTVNIGEKGKIRTIAKTPVAYSLGCFYSAITEYMGMKPLEHEYKVMGLAAYVHPQIIERSYTVFKKLIWLDADSLEFRSAVRNPYYYQYLEKNLKKHRFDQIAGAAQKITEEILIDLVRLAIRKTGIKNVALSGGVFMNVKANMKIMEIPEIEKLEIFPSCGDDSLPIGAAYLAAIEGGQDAYELEKVVNIYLGTEYTDVEVEKTLKDFDCFNKYNVIKCDNINEEVAKLLADNKIVARFSGRSEWGARALGNRSILANASNRDNIKIINDQIKGRDFWMPFAASILKDRAKDYIINEKNINAPYMILAFETRELAKKHLLAGLHPYDFTCRPQFVNEKQNPGYYELLKKYEELTGMGGILNTSLNLHGEPLVEDPADAIRTLENSGLQYLALENYLIRKKHVN